MQHYKSDNELIIELYVQSLLEDDDYVHVTRTIIAKNNVKELVNTCAHLSSYEIYKLLCDKFEYILFINAFEPDNVCASPITDVFDLAQWLCEGREQITLNFSSLPGPFEDCVFLMPPRCDNIHAPSEFIWLIPNKDVFKKYIFKLLGDVYGWEYNPDDEYEWEWEHILADTFNHICHDLKISGAELIAFTHGDINKQFGISDDEYVDLFGDD